MKRLLLFVLSQPLAWLLGTALFVISVGSRESRSSKAAKPADTEKEK